MINRWFSVPTPPAGIEGVKRSIFSANRLAKKFCKLHSYTSNRNFVHLNTEDRQLLLIPPAALGTSPTAVQVPQILYTTVTRQGSSWYRYRG